MNSFWLPGITLTVNLSSSHSNNVNRDLSHKEIACVKEGGAIAKQRKKNMNVRSTSRLKPTVGDRLDRINITKNLSRLSTLTKRAWKHL